MQAKLVRDAEKLNPAWSAEKAELAQRTGRVYRVPHSLPLPAGSVIDHPDCWQLVMQGLAVPEDEPCRVRCGLTADEMAELQARYRRLEEQEYDPETDEFLDPTAAPPELDDEFEIDKETP